MKTIAYIRVSTKEQAKNDKFGIPEQRRIIEKYAEKENMEVSEWFIDKGYSGSTMDRPELQALLNYVTENPSSVLVSYMDRWARDSFLFHFLNKELLTSKSELVSATEEGLNDDSPHAELMKNITMAFAQFERQRIAARMTGGRRHKAKAGQHATGRIPFGFRKNEHGEIYRVKEEADDVLMIFTLRENTPKTIADIAEFMRKHGKVDKNWSASSIRYILNNEKYKGKLTQVVGGKEIVSTNEVFHIV